MSYIRPTRVLFWNLAIKLLLPALVMINTASSNCIFYSIGWQKYHGVCGRGAAAQNFSAYHLTDFRTGELKGARGRAAAAKIFFRAI